ncbi:MAG TPA: VIT1/CCC1 transporter family protein [Actinomycetota bacterium]|nr:VIT1/CCC1 transporter family protein [Actinomycetota bacterium]
MGGKSGALRAAIFGVNDGLVSNLSLIMGVTGANVSNKFILVAGVAGLLAGAFSMGGGEYVSMRVQRELFERLLHIEAHELATEPEEEHEELREIYEQRGFPRDLAQRVTEVVMADPKVALDTHAREELGLDPEELGSPWGASISSFVMFSLGAAVPLIPFIVGSGTAAVLASVAASGTVLFAVGASMSLLTGRSAWLSGGRMLVIGGSLATVTYGVGTLLHVGSAVG